MKKKVTNNKLFWKSVKPSRSDKSFGKARIKCGLHGSNETELKTTNMF